MDVKDFVAKNIDRLASIDYGDVNVEETSTKVGKLSLKVISNQVANGSCESIGAEGDPNPSRLCCMIANGDFPLKDGDDIDYKDVEVGEQEEGEINTAIQAMIDRAKEATDQLASRSSRFGNVCLLYTSPSPRDLSTSRMPSSA